MKRAAGMIPAKLAACLLLVSVSLAIAAPVSAAGPTPTSSPGASSATPTPGCDPKTQRCPNSVEPNGVVNAARTGWSSASKTSMSFCNGKLYVAFAQADREIVVLWNWNGTLFNGHVKYADTAMQPTFDYFSAPALACWKPASGTWADKTRLWIAFTGTDKKLYYGFHEDTDVNGQRIEPYVNNGFHHLSMPNETSVRSPAMSVQSQTLRFGWIGINNNYINFQSTTDATTWFSKNTWRSDTAGAGFGMWLYCPGGTCNLWFAWPGTDSGDHINVFYYSLGGGSFQYLRDANNNIIAHPLPHQTCDKCDLTFVGQTVTAGPILRILYAGRNLDPDVLSSNVGGTVWSNDIIAVFGAVFGMSGAVVDDNHLWLSWVENGDTEVLFGQYN
jgi:hypothetical protein